MSRKTVDVSFVIDKTNRLLKRTDVSDDYRRGAICMLECILHATNNYNGFNYLSWIEKEGRELSGVEQWRKDSQEHFGNDAVRLPTEPYLGNEYRRVYYTPRDVGKKNG